MEIERQFNEGDEDTPVEPIEPSLEQPETGFNAPEPGSFGPPDNGLEGDVPSFYARNPTPGDGHSDSMSQFITRTMATVAEEEPPDDGNLIPRAPRTFAEVGLSKAFLTDLALKIMHYSGTPSMAQLAKRLGLHPEIVTLIVQSLREERLVEVMSQSDLYTGNYRYRLSDRGQVRVTEALERTRYAGPAPVTAEQYGDVMTRLFEDKQQTTRAEVTNALENLVLNDNNADAVARALFSGKTTLLYGPSGNGKTVILENYARALDGYSVMPYAIYAYGQVIRVFDASLHTPLDEQQDEDANSFKDDSNVDRRWVRIRRPAIILGAEMDRDALDLGYDPGSKFYQAPAHIKAQNGVLIVDDFGRQRVATTDLLTRWLIPLERGSDTLSMVTGEKLHVPFRLQLLLSTNARVRDVADEAMLRRILYKVSIPNPTKDNFGEILRRECEARGVTIENDNAVQHAVDKLYGQPQLKVRASYALDLVDILVESAKFDDAEAVLNKDTFDHVFTLFVAGSSEDEEKFDDDN